MPRCPQCREPVSAFAAGCAVCGADLEAARREQARRRARRPSLPALPSVPWLRGALVPGAVLVLVVLSFPLLGVLLAGLMLHRTTLSGDRALRVALWAVVAVGVVLLVSPATRYGATWLLLG